MALSRREGIGSEMAWRGVGDKPAKREKPAY
jgi:hypothetical protein